jgi:NADPH:quinone reductase-like Zn-dependent oxidoreductase
MINFNRKSIDNFFGTSVGTLAVLMLNELGYKVIASTGKQDVSDQLLDLGAKEN